MFKHFSKQWTVIAFSTEIRNKPVARALAGEGIVLWRDAEGHTRCVLDKCPHRGVKLSLGKVKDGCLECPFHGWQFKGDGACAHIPYNPVPDKKLGNYDASALPVYEEFGLVWVFTEVRSDRPELPYVPESIRDPGVAQWRHHLTWKTHWTRAMENMLDAAHLPFVHRWTIGTGMRMQLTDQSKMTETLEETDYGYRFQWSVDGQGGDATLRWRRPNAMSLDLGGGKRTYEQHIWCVPTEDNHTEMYIVSSRGFQVWNPIFWLFDWFNVWIVSEDQAVTESHDPPEVPRPVEEKSVSTDKSTLHFRNWYYRVLRDGNGDESSAGLAAK